MPLPAELARTLDWVADGVALVKPAEGHGAASLLLDEGGDVVLVDAGLPAAQRRRLAPHVDVCLLTHCHVAHSLGAHDFREVWAPKAEANALLGAEDYLQTYEVARRDRDLVASAIRKAGYEPSPVAKRISGQSILQLDRHEWHVLPAPGHSPGHVVLLEPQRHILFAGDLDGDSPPWYGLPSSDPTDLERTATSLVDVPVALLLSSHGEPRRRGIKPLFRQMAETVRERDRAILAALATPRTLDELTSIGLLWGKPETPLARYHERVMAEKHLARLLEKELVHARQDGRYQTAKSGR